MNRHEIRKEVFKAVFMNEFHDSDDINEIHDMFLNGRDAAEEEDLLKNNKSQEDEEYIKKKGIPKIGVPAMFKEAALRAAAAKPANN